MKFTNKNIKLITKIILIALTFNILFVVNLRCNDETNKNSIFEQMLMSQTVESDHYYLTAYDNLENAKGTVHIKSLTALGWDGIFPLLTFLLLFCLIFRFKNKLLDVKRNTLVFLCVRMNE